MVIGKDTIPVYLPYNHSICHLLFADDILIFCKSIPSSAAKLAKLLSLYQDSSGQLLNHDKSIIFMGKGNGRTSNTIKEIFNFKLATLPSMHPGAPLLIGCLRMLHFDALIASIRKRLSGWQAKALVSWAFSFGQACSSKYAHPYSHGSSPPQECLQHD